MADVFISYGRGDQEAARALARAVESLGWSAWWDRQLHAGIQFDREIERQLARASCVIVLWSARSIESDWVRAEAAEGLRRGILVPVALEPVDPPIVFRQTQTVALHSWDRSSDAAELREIWTAIEWLVSKGPRPERGSALPPAPEWVSIPGGPALLLEGPSREPELLAPFLISRFPVTREQFAAFSGELPDGKEAKLPQAGVSWNEAVAYCRWLSERLGREVTLPSELQWERSARGEQRWSYPWGRVFAAGRCNSREAGLGRVSEVGRFSAGASAYGVEELSGNVWEWCAGPEPRGEAALHDSAVALRPVRGGSFDLPARLVRCTLRHFLPGQLAGSYVGFRVVTADPGPASA